MPISPYLTCKSLPTLHPAPVSIAATAFWDYEAALDQAGGDEAFLLESLQAISFEANNDLREMSHILCQLNLNTHYETLVVYIDDIHRAVSASAQLQERKEQHKLWTSLEHAVDTLIQNGITGNGVKNLQQVVSSRSTWLRLQS